MASGEPTQEEQARPTRRFRFEGTIRPGLSAAAADELASLDVDRLPSDEEGAFRLLLTPDELATVVESGFEVVVQRVVPIRPLDTSLVLDDTAATAWLDEQLGGIQRDEET